MSNYDNELSAVTTDIEAMRAKMRLLWGILQVCKEHGWNEELNLVDWLDDKLGSLEKGQREAVAIGCLHRAKLLSAQLSTLLDDVSEERIMYDGTQPNLVNAQDVIKGINEQVKFIFDMRRGLTK